MTSRVITGDCREVLATLNAGSVQCCVTSPPYFNLRDYGTATWDGGDAGCDHARGLVPVSADDPGIRCSTLDGGKRTTTAQAEARSYRDTCGKCGARRIDAQLGLEASPDAYVAEMVAVFREIRRVLADDGTVWLNLGDSYSTGSGGDRRMGDPSNPKAGGAASWRSEARAQVGTKPKDLLMIPARVALALQADGWWLRSAITWCKQNAMPESVCDRPSSATEMVFLLAKSPKYFFDNVAIAEPAVSEGRAPGGNHKIDSSRNDADRDMTIPVGSTRNARNWWVINPQPFSGAHFATMPPELAERCIKAGTRPGDTVLDPFAGAGTTLLCADRLGRNGIGVELNPAYAVMARNRVRADCPLFADVAD